MVEINLLPQGQRRSQSGGWRQAAIAVPLVALALMGTAQVLVSAQNGRIAAELREERALLAAEGDATARRDALRAEVGTLDATNAAARALRDDQQTWSADFADFAAQLPNTPQLADVAFNEVNMNAVASEIGFDGAQAERVFVVRGLARTDAALESLLSAFEANPRYAIALRQAALDDESSAYTFEADIGLLGREQPAAEEEQ